MTNNSNTIIPADSPILLTIESMAYGGRGVARKDGKTYFVEDAFPGEEVLCVISEDKDRFAIAKPIEFTTRSPARVESICKVAGACGGCQWLESPYQLQLEWKRKFIIDAFQRIARIELEEHVEIEASENQFHYRNRVTLRGTVFKNGTIRVGYFMKESRTQVHVEHCHIASQRINRIIDAINKATTKISPQKFRLELQEIPARAHGEQPCILATIFPAEKNFGNLKQFADDLQKLPEILWAGMSSDLKDAPTTLFEEDENKFYSMPGLFQQVNTQLNLRVRQYIKKITEKLDSKFIVDLFCGSGNLSLGLASQTRRVAGVEFDRKAIQIAKFNVNENHCPNVRYDSGDAKGWLEKLLKTGSKPDLVIADPPRRGMKELMMSLKNLLPANIVYVSCDPATLARDIGLLTDCYSIVSVRAFDFFPNTFHVETVVHLSLK